MWVAVAAADAIDEDDVIEVEAGAHLLCVYHTEAGYFASDAICTHEHAHLADGLVLGTVIECPKHQGRFDVRDGSVKGAPASIPLCTYPVKIEDGTVHVDVPGADASQS